MDREHEKYNDEFAKNSPETEKLLDEVIGKDMDKRPGVITTTTPQYPCPDNIDPEKWATKSDDHKKAVLNTINKGGPK